MYVSPINLTYHAINIEKNFFANKLNFANKYFSFQISLFQLNVTILKERNIKKCKNV